MEPGGPVHLLTCRAEVQSNRASTVMQPVDIGRKRPVAHACALEEELLHDPVLTACAHTCG